MKATMSGLGRVELCPPSAFLPPIEESGRDADRGRAIHDYLKNVATVGFKKAVEQVPEAFRDECVSIDLDLLPHSDPGAWAVEVGLAWDWEADTGRELFRGDGRRDYSSAGPSELCGTADILGVTSDAVVVLDVKTGWGRLAPPGEAPQLLGYAVAAARAYGKERAIVGWIRLRDEQPYYEQATLDLLELDAGAARLRAIVETAQGAELIYRADPTALALSVGAHCRYCPAYRQCPANVGLLKDLVYRDQVGEVPVLNAETAPLALVRAEAAQKVLDRVMATLREYASTSPINLPDGQCFGNVETTQESIDALVAKEVLAEDLWDEVVEIKHVLTKAALKRALRKRLEPGEKITHVERDCLKALGDAGALKEKVFWSVKRFTPKKEAPAPQLPAVEPTAIDPEPVPEPKPKPAEVLTFPKVPLVMFGPLKGKVIAGLSADELSGAIALAQERFDAEPFASWAQALSGNLDHLLEEQQRRIDEIGGAA